jgi:ubiquinone/menaquinone biosynthesis C-methylase UbiE
LQKRFQVLGLNGEFVLGIAEELEDVFDRKFELVYSFVVLHHIPSLDNALKSIIKICHDETVFKFMVYAKNSHKNVMMQCGIDQPEAQTGCPIANIYYPEEIVSALLSTGFKVTSIS